MSSYLGEDVEKLGKYKDEDGLLTLCFANNGCCLNSFF